MSNGLVDGCGRVDSVYCSLGGSDRRGLGGLVKVRLAVRSGNGGLCMKSRRDLGDLASSSCTLLNRRSNSQAGRGKREKNAGRTHFTGLKSDLW